MMTSKSVSTIIDKNSSLIVESTLISAVQDKQRALLPMIPFELLFLAWAAKYRFRRTINLAR